MPASRPSLPGETHPRRLGVGGGPGGGDRVLRAQLVIALVLGFTVLAVLLYLLRRPAAEHADDDAAPGGSASAAASASSPVIVRTKVEPAKKEPERVKLGGIQHVKCGASPKLTSSESSLCDSLPFFEQGLIQAVQSTVDCAPKAPEEGTLNYVLSIDFRTKDVRVYPGRSGSFRGKQAKKASECVRRALSAPDWASISHQYRYYAIAVLATYPPAMGAGSEGLPDFK